jgi:hypothetical protein
MEKSMRFASLLLLFVFLGLTAQAQGTLQLGNSQDNPDPTMIEFEQTEYDLGTIKAGEIVKSTFKFKNIGDADLYIDNVKPSCACTALEFPKTAIKPGATGEIYAEIDTEDKEGDQVKYFSVMYNGNPPVERVKLIFKVLPPEGAVEQGQEDGTGIK